MNLSTVFTKSAKGVMELSSRASRLPRDLMKVLKLVDGKSTVRQLAEAAGVSPASLLATMEKLEKEGYVKEFVPGGGSQATQAKTGLAPPAQDEGESLDFTIILNTGPLRPRSAEADADRRAQEEAQRRAREEAAARAREEAQRRARLEAEAKAREEAARQARLAAERRAKAFAEACREADAAARALADTQRRLDPIATALAKARAEADRHGKHLAEHKAKSEALGIKSQTKLEALAEAIAAAQAKAQALSTALEQASSQAQLLALACGHAENRLAALQRALEAADPKQKAELDRARSATEEQLEDLREARDTADRVVDSLTRAQAEALAEGNTLTEARARIEAEAAARAERLAAALARAQQEANTREAVRQALEKQRPQTAQALERAETLARDLSVLAAQVRSLDLPLEGQVQAAEAAEAQARTWAEALDGAVTRLEAMIPPLQEAIARGRNQAAALEEALGASEGDTEPLRETLQRVRAETATLDQELATVAGRLDALRRTRAHAREEAEAFADLATRARTEAERLAREEAQRQAREAAERQAREEEERRRQEEAERLAREELERRTREAEEQRRQEQECLAREAEERQMQEEAQRLAREGAPHQAQEEAQRPAPEAAEAQAIGQAAPKSSEEARPQDASQPFVHETTAQEEAPPPRLEQAPKSLPGNAEPNPLQIAPSATAEEAALAALGIEGVDLKLFNPETTQQLPSAAQLERELEQEAQERARKQQEDDERLRREEERERRHAEERARQEALFRAQAEAERTLWAEAETHRLPLAPTPPATPGESAPLPAAEETPAPTRPRRPKVALGRWLGLGIAVTLAGALTLAQVLPWEFAVPAAQAVLSARLGEPVSVEEVHGALFPAPQLRLHGIKVGKDGALIAEVLTATGFAALLGRSDEISAIQLENVSLSAAALERLEAWNRPLAANAGTALERITARQVRVVGAGMELPPFDAELSLATDGTVRHITVRAVDGSLSGALVPSGTGLKIQVQGQIWKAPFGLPLVFENLQVKANAAPGRLQVEQFDALLYGGRVMGSGSLAWDGLWTAQGKAELVSVDLAALFSAYLGHAPITGTLKSRMQLELAGRSLQSLFEAPRLRGEFVVERGALTGVDLSQALRGGSAGSSRGETAFQQLTGSMVLAAHRYEFRNLSLAAGILSASGTLEVAPDRSLSGGAQVEIRSETNPLRGYLAVKGSVTQPLARP
jgi:DNA-binding Lrp family transcriptional regulator